MKCLFAASAAALLLSSLPAFAASGAAESFSPCADGGTDPHLAGSLCATLRVPLERGTKTAAKAALFLRQFPAETAARGQVWLVTGESGAALYPLIGALHQAFPGYDLIVPDRRGTGRSIPAGLASSPANAAFDLQAEIDRYAGGGSTLLYGTSKGSEIVLRSLSLVKPRRVAAVILDSPARSDPPAAPLSAIGRGGETGSGTAEPSEPGLDLSTPRILVLQGEPDAAPPAEIEKDSPVTTYTIDGASGTLMVTEPECAAPLVRGFLDGADDAGAPCAARLTIRF